MYPPAFNIVPDCIPEQDPSHLRRRIESSSSPAPVQSAEQFCKKYWHSFYRNRQRAMLWADWIAMCEAYAASLHSSPDLEKQFIIQRDRAEEFAKQVAEQQREIERLQEYPARYAKLLRERDLANQMLRESLEWALDIVWQECHVTDSEDDMGKDYQKAKAVLADASSKQEAK